MRSHAPSGMTLGGAVRKDEETKENGKAWQWIEVRMMVNISLDTAAVPAPRNAKSGVCTQRSGARDLQFK